jgi:hypothetical protein
MIAWEKEKYRELDKNRIIFGSDNIFEEDGSHFK